MAEPIISKTCQVCKQTKPIAKFHKQRARKDGHQAYCKSCKAVYMKLYGKTEKCQAYQKQYLKKYRQTDKYKQYNREYRKSNPEKCHAQDAVKIAIRGGRLPRPDDFQCSCDKQAKEYHHPSYAPEHRLDVIPVCLLCHFKLRLTS